MTEDRDYPVFNLDEDGNIVSDRPDLDGTFGNIDDVYADTNNAQENDLESAGDDLSESEDDSNDFEEDSSVSGGNVLPEVAVVDLQSLEDINDNLSRIVREQASSAGYLSTSALETFDRVVAAFRYDYHIAFRYDSDNYNAVMYLSDSVVDNGNNILLHDALAVRLYRQYISSGRYYTYHYSTSSVGDVSVNMSGNLMYYTNCVPGYPVLGGDPAPGNYPGWFIPLIAVLIFWVLINFLRRRN